MKFTVFFALLASFLFCACSKTEGDQMSLIEITEQSALNDTTHLYVKELSESLHLSWISKINRNQIASFQIKIDSTFTLTVSKNLNQISIPKKRDFYGKSISISAVLNNNKSIRLDSVTYETNYSRFFKSKTKYIAHRGLSMQYPENTPIAFEKAAAAGYEFVECDLWLTKDNKWVLIHDETIDRTSNKSGKVSNFTLDELKKFDFGYYKKFGTKFPQKIPTLDEFVSLCKELKLKPVFEIKVSDPSAEQLIQLLNVINARLGYDSYAVHSFSLPILYGLRGIDPSVTLGYIAYNLFYPKKDIINLYPCFYNVSSAALNLDQPLSDANKAAIANFSNTGVYLATWTVNDPKYFKQLVDNKFYVITGATPP